MPSKNSLLAHFQIFLVFPDDYEDFDLDFIEEEGELVSKEESDDVSYNPNDDMRSERENRLKNLRQDRSLIPQWNF